MSFFDPIEQQMAAFEAHLDSFVPEEVLDEMAATPDHFVQQDAYWDGDEDNLDGDLPGLMDRVERRRFP